MNQQLQSIMRKIFGDHRDKTTAIHEAGFEDEAAAARWASSISTTPVAEVSELAFIKQIRQARPDLTLGTATYIARRAKARNP